MSTFSNEEVSKFKSKKGLYWNWLIPLGIFFLFVVIYYLNSRIIWDMVSKTQDIIFGSDTRETINQLKMVTHSEDTKKHLLFSATLTPIAKSIQTILGLSQSKSIRLTLAIVGALNITGVYLFLKKYSSSVSEALLFTGFYSFFYANFVIFSIPETYSMSNLFILVYITTFFAFRNSMNVYKSMLLSVIAGVASLYNPVLLSLMIIHISFILLRGFKMRRVLISLSNLTIGALIYFIANYLSFENQFLAFVDRYVERYASFNHFLDINSILSVFSNFYLYSILSPRPYMSPSLGYSDWLGYGDTIIGIIISLLIGIFLVYGIYILFRNKYPKEEFVMALLPWTVLMALAYVYFNPREAMLYSSQILLPIVIVFIHAFKTLNWKLPIKYSVFSFCLLAIAYMNASAFLNGVR